MQGDTAMKNLVLGALLAAASSFAAGCTSSGTTVTVSWDFQHLSASNTGAPSALSCPTDFPTATIISQRTDDSTHVGFGDEFIDHFNCSDGIGTIVLPDEDSYLVWVEIETDSGSSTYAQSNSTYVNTAFAVEPINVNIVDNGGYFFFEWDLVDAKTNAPLACTDIGSGSVEAISTSVASPSYFKDDKFDCDAHYGTTDPLIADTYTVSIDAEDSTGALGPAKNLTNKTIHAPNGLTDLGLVLIPVD